MYGYLNLSNSASLCIRLSGMSVNYKYFYASEKHLVWRPFFILRGQNRVLIGNIKRHCCFQRIFADLMKILLYSIIKLIVAKYN